MANNVFKIKRTSTTGRAANTSTLTNPGELALNMTDGIMYSTNGSSVFEVGANLTSAHITNSLTFDNDRQLRFKTVNTSSYAYFVQQSDDNFVFYTTNGSYSPRAIFSIFANSGTSPLSIGAPVAFTGPNVSLGTAGLSSNGSLGGSGQVLTSNGSATYWSTPSSGSGGVNTAAQYTWTNTHTFSANVSFTGSGIGVNSNTGSVYFGGISDANWRISRNAGITTKFFYTNNTLDIIAASSPKEGIVFGWTGNSYLEVGYAGTYTTLPIYVGNSSVNTTINATSFTGTSNNSLYLGGTAAASYVQNTDSRTLSGNLTFSGANLSILGTNTYITSNVLIGTTASFYSINGQANATSGNFIANAYATLSGAGGNYLAFGQQTNFSQWIQSGYSAASPVYYNIILNPLGGNVGIGNTVPTHKLSINGNTYISDTLTVGTATVNTTNFTGTANNTSFVGSVSAANVVSNAQLSGNLSNYVTTTNLTNNLANYQTTAGLAANVVTLAANSATYLGNSSGTIANVSSWITTNASAAYTNSVSYTDSKIATANSAITGNAATAYTNAVSYVDGKSYVNTSQLSSNLSNYQTTAGLASNVATLAANSATYLGNSSGTIANVATWITSNASAAYTNAVSYTDAAIGTANSAITGNAATAYTNAVSYTDSKILTANSAITGNAATAYTNATNFASNASNISSGTLAEARLPYRMNQNIRTTDSITLGDLTLTGNLYVGSNVNIIGSNNLSLVDNMIYLNANNTVANPDLGFAGNYNDGSYHHAGFFRDASDGIWKVFDNYDPEPDANSYIDTTNTTFHIANFQANVIYVGNTSVYSTVNTTNFTGTANNTLFVGSVASDNVVSNTQLQSNIQYFVNTSQLSSNLSNYVTTTNLSNNLANYQTTAGLAANVALLAANSATYLGNSSGTIANVATWITSNASAAYTNAVSYVDGKSYVNTSQLSSNLSNYQTTAGLSANVATLTANNTTYVNGKTEGNLNVNSAATLATTTNIGDVSFNGSSNIVPERITFKDTRNTNYNPFSYPGISLHLKTNTTDSLSDGGTYHGVLDLQHWSDSSGGVNHQLGFTDNGNIHIRYSTGASSWSSWSVLQLNSTLNANIASYLPTYTGTVNGAIISTGSVNVINASGLTTTANVNIGAAGELIITAGAGIYANGGLGTAGQVLASNGTSIYWSTVSGGASLTANTTDTQTFYFPMANTTSGSWSNGVVANTKLYFVPSTGTLSATIFNSLSDAEYKTNVKTIENSLDVVDELRGVYFNWKTDNRPSVGVIAQEVEKVLPELVTEHKGKKSVNYDGLIGVLIESIKELKQEIDILKNEKTK